MPWVQLFSSHCARALVYPCSNSHLCPMLNYLIVSLSKLSYLFISFSWKGSHMLQERIYKNIIEFQIIIFLECFLG